MLKHRGFPGRLPGTDFQFVIRRENRKKGATPIARRIARGSTDMDQDAPQQLVQMELVEDENSTFFRMGWTVPDAEAFIEQCRGKGE